jgi:CubicO group peptidase (beta-lactamase class C family)
MSLPGSTEAWPAVVQEYQQRHEVPGVLVSAFDSRAVLHTVASGVASLDSPHAPLDDTVMFPIYSVSKLLTAAVIARLHVLGVLDLDRRVIEYLPQLRTRQAVNQSALSLRHLLSHTSGLLADTVSHDGASRNMPDLATEALRLLRRTPMACEAGRTFSYSNLGITLAAAVAEQVCATPFDQLAAGQLLEPLAMHSTTYDPAVAMTYPLVQHHILDSDGRLRVSHEPRAGVRHGPAGLCYSTVADLARLGQALLGRLPDPGWRKTVALMARPQVEVLVDSELRYGLGTMMTSRGRHHCLGHEGTLGGITCKLLVIPDRGIGLVWVDNRGSELRRQRYAAIDALLQSLRIPPVNQRARTDRPVCISAVAGSYTRPGASTLQVWPVSGDDLDISDGRGSARLARAGDRVWAADSGPVDVPPWMPHMDSSRCAFGVGIDRWGSVTHAQLNGISYLRVPAERKAA